MYRQTITFTDECKELEVLDKGLSIRRASEKFSVPKSTVADIKKNKEKIRHFV
jgi:transposase